MINHIKLKNFQLFKTSEINLEKINLITGINMDSPVDDNGNHSSNGSAKSTLAKNAITFVLYGDVPGINLRKLIHFGEKTTSVELEYKQGNNTYRIIRKIPTYLSIHKNNEELKFNTSTIAQKYINETFGNYEYFRKYRMIDIKGINLLDLGIVSLRKSLMEFIDDLFTTIRKNLLAKKLNCETYNVNKRLYSFHLSEKRLIILEQGLKKSADESTSANQSCTEQYKIINNLKSDIQSKQKEIHYKNNEFKKAKEGICPILKEKCDRISKALTDTDNKQNKNLSYDIEQMSHKIEQLKSELKIEEDCMNHYKDVYDSIQNSIHKIKNNIMKLKEAFKFKDYKYTAKDVLLYSEAIKVLDSFAGYYIGEWLNQLELIINDLLKSINMSIEFTNDKNFIKVKDNKQELDYASCSSGQKTFLSAIFKLAILLHKGENSGIIIADEGLGNLDAINLKRFITICNELNFQVIIIYHNLSDIDNVKKITVIRQNNVSNIK